MGMSDYAHGSQIIVRPACAAALAQCTPDRLDWVMSGAVSPAGNLSGWSDVHTLRHVATGHTFDFIVGRGAFIDDGFDVCTRPDAVCDLRPTMSTAATIAKAIDQAKLMVKVGTAV